MHILSPNPLPNKVQAKPNNSHDSYSTSQLQDSCGYLGCPSWYIKPTRNFSTKVHKIPLKKGKKLFDYCPPPYNPILMQSHLIIIINAGISQKVHIYPLCCVKLVYWHLILAMSFRIYYLLTRGMIPLHLSWLDLRYRYLQHHVENLSTNHRPLFKVG